MPIRHTAAFFVAEKWADNERGATFLVSGRVHEVGWFERGREDSMEADDWIWEQMCSYFTEQSFLMFEI